jgi:hypothetical protein
MAKRYSKKCWVFVKGNKVYSISFKKPKNDEVGKLYGIPWYITGTKMVEGKITYKK